MAAKLEKTRTPGVFKRGSRYVVTFRHRGPSTARASAPTRRRARRRLAATAGSASRPLASAWPSTPSAGSAATAGGPRVASRSRRWSCTAAGSTSTVLPFLGWMRLREVGADDVREWMGWLERRGASANTVRQARAALSAMFATAREAGLVQTNPAAGARYVAAAGAEQPKRKRRALTEGDVAKILGALPPQWLLFFELLTHSGLRFGELSGLTWGHVELGDEPCIRVREQVYQGRRKKLKTDSSVGTIPLSPGMARKLQTIRAAGVKADALVFPSKTGRPLSYANMYNRVLHPALRKCGLAVEGADGKWDYQGIGFHAFRKACGSFLLARAGKDLKQVQGWLRHSRLSTTLDSYIHEVDGGLGSADALDEIVRLGGDNGVTTGHRSQPQAKPPPRPAILL
jgi:integrase